MRVWITGAAGQVGRALQASAPVAAQVLATGSAQCNIADAAAVARLSESFAPELIINAAAYTAVDAAETAREAAFAVNAEAVDHLRAAATRLGAQLVQISTDFVFNGRASSPYKPDAARDPLSAYGASKAAGEDAAGPEALIVRTAWVYDREGRNFVTTMLRLMRERREIRVVADQIGTPTATPTLARAIWSLADQARKGLFHVTDSGVASWYDFAVAIYEEGLSLGLLDHPVSIIPIATQDYPTPAARPAYSVLDKTQTVECIGVAPHWRQSLRAMLAQDSGQSSATLPAQDT